MNLNQLETFLWVAELKSFTAAARHLYMSQPAISFQIKAIEEELKVPLFQRKDKKVVLTEAGSLFYNEAREIVEHYYKIIEGIDNIKGLKIGELNCGASTIPGEYILPGLIGGFKELYPGINVSLRIGASGDVAEWVQNKEVALGVTGAPVDSKDLECEPWMHDELVCIASPQAVGNKKEMTLEELVSFPLVLREKNSGTRKNIEKQLSANGIQLERCNVVMELGSTRAVITAVEAGLGVSFVSRWAVKEPLNLGKLAVVEVPRLLLGRELYLVRNPQARGGSFAASVFMEYVKKNSDN